MLILEIAGGVALGLLLLGVLSAVIGTVSGAASNYKAFSQQDAELQKLEEWVRRNPPSDDPVARHTQFMSKPYWL